MNICENRLKNTLVLELEGRLDSSTANLLETLFTQKVEQGERLFVFDFSNLQYISSAGLRVMLVAAKKLKATGGKLSLCGMNDNVLEVFQISGFTNIFSIYPQREEALISM